MEVLGFWVLMSGWVLLILSSTCSGKWVSQIEKNLGVPWYVQIFFPALSVIMMMAGWHIWCLGNRGRYPGYPLDVIIEWFR